MRYVEVYGDEFLLRPVRGIKPEARMGTLIDQPVAGRRTVFDPARMREIVSAYEAAPVLPSKADTRATRRAYARFVQETRTQYRFITEELGIEVIVVDKNPYPDRTAMIRDIAENNRLKVLSTESTGGHPLLSNAENDMFRAVHDFFGHAGLGNTFTRHGETVAYLKHAQMYSELARGAMFSETMAQSNALIARGGKFAPQKAVILPRKFWSNKTLDADPAYLTGSDQGRRLDTMFGEEILDLVAYTNGDMERPIGTVGAFEHQWTDPSGQRLVHMSPDTDFGAPNSGRVWVVERDGMWSYFADAQALRHQPGATAVGRPRGEPKARPSPPPSGHQFTETGGQLYWDNAARIVNRDEIRWNERAKHLFDVTVDGKVPTEVALFLPEGGMGLPEIAYNRRTIPGRSPARTVVLTRSGGSFKAGRQTLVAEVPGTPDGTFHSNLNDDLHDFLYQTGWVGDVKPTIRGA